MGNGMADFIESEVLTVKDYDKYCHYVAGLVGIGLSKVPCSFKDSNSHITCKSLSPVPVVDVTH